MNTPVITVENLSKRYTLRHQARSGLLRDKLASLLRNPFRQMREARTTAEEFWALREVNFSVNQGDVLGIIGRNGAGKSTLLKILSRITEPTTGLISIRGRVASLLEVGTGFHGELSGRENIFLNGAILGMTRAEIRKKFDEIVAFAEVDKFLDTPVKHYSSGMYVRLAFAVAAHLEPEILIVDEVLAVGDAQFQKKCLGKMQEVSTTQGRTVLFVSHNLGTISSLCRSSLWLDGGRLRQIGSTNQIVTEYLRCFTPEHSMQFDLAKTIRAAGLGTKLRLTRLEINQGRPLVNREPMTALIRFKTSAPAMGVSIGLGLSTVDGTRLLTTDSDYHLQRHDFRDGIESEVELSISALHLGPGTYSIDVGARSGETAPLDYIGGVGIIEVHASSEVPAGFALLGGGVRTPANWKWS